MNNQYIRLIILFICACFSSLTYAAGDGDLWVPLVTFTCLAQTPSNLQTTMGKQLTTTPEYTSFVTSPQGEGIRCVAKQKIIPQALCTTLLNQTDDTFKSLNLDALHEQYSQTFDKLGGAMTACEKAFKTYN